MMQATIAKCVQGNTSAISVPYSVLQERGSDGCCSKKTRERDLPLGIHSENLRHAKL